MEKILEKKDKIKPIKISIILSNTGFQYSAAYALASHLLRLKKNVFLIKSGTADQGIEPLSSEINRKITKLNLKIFHPRVLTFLLRLLLKLRVHIFLGDPLSQYNVSIIDGGGPNKVSFYDDGVATLGLAENNCWNVRSVGKRKPRREPSEYKIYTIFQTIKRHRSISLVDEFKCLYTMKKKQESRLVILGSPLFQLGRENAKSFQEKLEKSLGLSNFSTVEYKPHRAESIESVKFTNSVFDWVLDERRLTLERKLIEDEKLPSTIVGFLSTGLFSASILYPEIDIYYILPPVSSVAQERHLRAIEKHAVMAGFKKIDV